MIDDERRAEVIGQVVSGAAGWSGSTAHAARLD
jgi:hypothetical protein